jgi:hypothetical protein
MAVIAYTKHNITKNVWSIMYSGTSDFAMTSFTALNMSSASAGLTLAIGDGTIVEGANSAFNANSEVVSTNTGVILINDTVTVGQTLYWDTAAGKIIIPAGKQLVVAITGSIGSNVEIGMFGLEL